MEKSLKDAKRLENTTEMLKLYFQSKAEKDNNIDYEPTWYRMLEEHSDSG